MAIATLPGVTGPQLLQMLDGAHSALRNVRVRASTGLDLYNAYLAWSALQMRMLRYTLTTESLNRLVTTRRHWALLSLDPAGKGNNLALLVEVELDSQLRALEIAMVEVRRDLKRHATVDAFVVPDTNVFIHAPVPFDELAWDTTAQAGQAHLRLLVPMMVIDELDGLKNRGTGTVSDASKEPVRSRARTTLRILERLLAEPAEPVILTPESRPAVSLMVLFDDPDHARLLDADSEIIDRTRTVADATGKAATVASYDLGMRLRARMAGLETVDPPTARSGAVPT
ncbi:PIN domain-containing protein [Actinotalea sp. JY-7885]|uniref:PIN domain-containing protein n=1 Tax=Actinotalea sp. JY-7885 TaxID=2758576 RepID=UPI00165E06B0|nr:PIN domain-containing protein [Actinotalea sp. JY-7885]